MADELDTTTARLAVLEVMGWDDDRGVPPIDGVPAEPCWSLAGELVDAVAAALPAAPARPVDELLAERFRP